MKQGLLCFIFFITSILQLSCTKQAKKTDFPYDLSRATKTYKLPNELDEISGLAYAGKDKIYCVQDEKGDVFLYDLNKEKITRTLHFAGHGDYEDITLTNKDIYVLKSNGTLYAISQYEQDQDITVEKTNTFLNSSCDAEGLCYDKNKNRLLVACKGNPNGDKKTKKSKAVYAFDLVAKALQEPPVLIVDIEDVHQMKRSGKKQNAFEESISSLWKGNFAFKPSAIAIHPITGDVYMLSSVGNTLVVLFGDGKLRYAIDLKHSQFKQPEGITFDAMGTLFISNESRGGKANIKAFSYIARP